MAFAFRKTSRLVGFDDQAESAFATPPLTTMRQPAVEMGEAAAAKALVKLIHNEPYELACSAC